MDSNMGRGETLSSLVPIHVQIIILRRQPKLSVDIGETDTQSDCVSEVCFSQSYEAVDKISADIDRRMHPFATADTCFTA